MFIAIWTYNTPIAGQRRNEWELEITSQEFPIRSTGDAAMQQMGDTGIKNSVNGVLVITQNASGLEQLITHVGIGSFLGIT